MEPWSGSRGESPSPRRRSAGLRASPSANPVGAMRPRSHHAVPHVRLLRRTAALSLGMLALATGSAAASDTGGATAQVQSARPSTKQVQKALGIRADGVMGPQTVRALKRFQRAHGIRVTGKVNAAT